MTPSNEEIRGNLLAWIHDLRTTDAKQGMGCLRSLADEYCCLGRACVVLGIPLDVREIVNGVTRWTYKREDIRTAQLDHPEYSRFGLIDEEANKCWQLNDSGKTFGEIAAWLEANVLPRYPAEAALQMPGSVSEAVAG